jgi:hypothetical protein
MLSCRGFTRKILLSVVCVFLIAANSALAANTYTYKVYAGGIDALRAHLTIDEKSNDFFDIELKAYTRGFLAKLAPWQGVFSSKTRKIGNRFIPKRHKSVSVWRDETETKEYKYDKDGQFRELVITEHNNVSESTLANITLTKDTTDILSATLNMLINFPQNGELCESYADIFDGKRRFQMMFKDKKKVTLEATRYNSYAGSATECTVEIVPDGGEWHETPRGWLSIQEQGREKGTMPTVWIAKLEGEDHAIPVKIRVKTDYGTLFMHVTDSNIGDTS